ncbi:hypothetical protein BASA81_003021 [Batrachochytrium salamandrivorans]|nr:hypothetical protein BASA81_003021 [Batrachochytrium salamandrivorans]
MASTVKARLPPQNGDWTNCCVPIDALLEFSHRHVTRRRLARRFVFFAIYLIVLYVAFIPQQDFFLSNSRIISDMMFWDAVFTPREIVQTLELGQTSFSQAQWWGSTGAGHDIRSWQQYQTWAQTRLLYYAPCVNSSTESCVIPTLVQQSESTQFSSCVDTNEQLICINSLVSSENCYHGALGNQVWALAPNSSATCTPDGLGLYFACGLDGNTGWVSYQLDSSPVAVAQAFNTNPALPIALTETSRTITVSNTLLRGELFQSISFQAGQLLSGLLALTPQVWTITFTPDTAVTAPAVLLCIVVIIDIALFMRRLWFHPDSVWGPWIVLDLVMLAMYGLLFYALNDVWSNAIFAGPLFGNDANENCDTISGTDNRSFVIQFYGALLGMSFIQILRFLCVLPVMNLITSSLLRTFTNAGGTMFVILIVYMLNAVSVMIFFGAMSPIFVYFGGAFFSTIILPEGFDVSFISGQMHTSRPNDDIPAFYLTLVVFVVNRCVTGTVTAFVCVVFWMQRKEYNKEDQKLVDDPKRKWTLRKLGWFVYHEVIGARPYENVNVETAYARLYRFSRERENLLRNFITYEEIMFVIGLPKGKFGTCTRVQPEQVVALMQLCGLSNIYLNVDAKRCEAKWSEQVVEEGGSRVYKRKTYEQIALFTSRSTRVERERGLTIKTCIQTAHALRVRQHQQFFFQKVEPLCVETVDKQNKVLMDIARLEVHSELVFTILPRLGIVMLAECFTERVFNMGVVHVDFVTCKKLASPTPNKPDEEIGIEIVNDMLLHGLDNASGASSTNPPPNTNTSTSPTTSSKAYAIRQAKQYNMGIKSCKRRLLRERNLKRYSPSIRLAVTDEWLQLDSIPTKTNYMYFLIQGARLRIQSHKRAQFPSSLVFNGRLQLACRLRNVENSDDNNKPPSSSTSTTKPVEEEKEEWALTKSFREAAREDGYTSFAFEQDLLAGAEWTKGLLPELVEGEFVADISSQETEGEFWIDVTLDRGVVITHLDLDSPLQQKILQSNVPCYSGKDAEVVLESDVRDKHLILTHVQSHRMRSVQDVAFASLSFRSFPNEVDEFPKSCLKFVRTNKRGNGKQEFEVWL